MSETGRVNINFNNGTGQTKSIDFNIIKNEENGLQEVYSVAIFQGAYSDIKNNIKETGLTVNFTTSSENLFTIEIRGELGGIYRAQLRTTSPSITYDADLRVKKVYIPTIYHPFYCNAYVYQDIDNILMVWLYVYNGIKYNNQYNKISFSVDDKTQSPSYEIINTTNEWKETRTDIFIFRFTDTTISDSTQHKFKYEITEGTPPFISTPLTISKEITTDYSLWKKISSDYSISKDGVASNARLYMEKEDIKKEIDDAYFDYYGRFYADSGGNKSIYDDVVLLGDDMEKEVRIPFYKLTPHTNRMTIIF